MVPGRVVAMQKKPVPPNPRILRSATRVLTPLLAVLLLGCGLGTGGRSEPGPDAAPCGVGDDEKILGQSPRIYYGTTDPEICMSDKQIDAVGALLFEEYEWDNACTGTLITDRVVLTAAHCVQTWRGNLIRPNTVRFAVGPSAAQPLHVFAVTSVHAHPSYQGDASNDVGLLVLAESTVEAGLDILPIPPNTQGMESGFVGEWVQNVGYGATHNNEYNRLRNWTTEEITRVRDGEFTVYGQGESSVCYGDSGGPSLFLLGQSSLSVLGTVSWGDPSCVDYDHFARVDATIGFIETYAGPVEPCMGIGTGGICDGNVALWCEDGRLVQQCCGVEGLACRQASPGTFRCIDECQGITHQGICEGTDAVWCQDGQLRRRRCEPCDQDCGWAGDFLGYYCLDR